MPFTKFKGLFTALITPFNDDYSIDYEGLRENVAFQIEQGVQGVVVLGSTGESPTILKEERGDIISTVVRAVNGKIPVVVGTGTYSTSVTIANTEEAKNLGADAALIVVPYYNKPTQEGIYHHYATIAKRCHFPFIAYNVPSRTVVNLEPETFKKMGQMPELIGIKECQFTQISAMLESCENVILFSGDDPMALPAISLGGHGLISAASNLFPKAMVELVGQALQGNFDEARAHHMSLCPLFKHLFAETNPILIKEGMNVLGLAAGPLRPPLCPASDIHKTKLLTLLKTYEKKSEFRPSFLQVPVS